VCETPASSDTTITVMRLLLQLCLYASVTGLPTVLITTPKPWCVTVEGAQDEALLVEYEAPGRFCWLHFFLGPVSFVLRAFIL